MPSSLTTPIASVRLVGPAGDAATVASAAATHAFPKALVARIDTLSSIATPEISSAREVLVLLAPTIADLEQASTATDARGWPRWSIVACTTAVAPPDSHVLHVSPDDWTEPMLELAIGTAVRLHDLKATNALLRGDLRSISRRLGHDIRSPLNSITAASEVLVDPDVRPDSPQATFARSISDSVDEVMSMFERVSFIMKATTNPPPRQSVIMEEIVWGALQRLESRMKDAGVEVSKPEKWPIIEGVPAWLDAIYFNLLANSVQHAGAKPKIELGWEQLPEGYRFWVRDQGGGVPAKQANLLFFPLDRLSELNAPRGLGLPIVHRLVELQGGRCGHEPAPQGSGTFYFVMPSAVAAV